LAARNRIAVDRNLLSVSCAAHLFNLLVGEISKLPNLQKTLNKAKSIVKEFKGSKSKLGEYLKEYERWTDEEKGKGNKPAKPVMLTLPSITRWFAIRDLLYKLLRAKPVLLRLAIREDFNLSQCTRSAIKDDNFWDRMKSIFPLYKALTDGKPNLT